MYILKSLTLEPIEMKLRKNNRNAIICACTRTPAFLFSWAMRNLFQCINLFPFTTLYMQKDKSIFMHFHQQLLLRPQVRGHRFIPVFWLDHWCIPAWSTAPALQDFAHGLLPKSFGNLEHLARWFAPAGSLAASDGLTRSIKPEPQSPGASHMSFSVSWPNFFVVCIFNTLGDPQCHYAKTPGERVCWSPEKVHISKARAALSFWPRSPLPLPCALRPTVLRGREPSPFCSKCSSFKLELSSWLQGLPQVQGHPGPLRNPGCAQEGRRKFSCHGNWLVPGDLEMAIT